jgi:hypothetical protein
MARMAIVLLALAPGEVAAAAGPCDILVAAGNPCVAAHSTVRALYAAYNGPLYRVSRTDGHDADVGVLEAGGFANISAQEGFCAAGDCNISKIYDQSGKGNHLTQRISCVPGQGCVYHKMVNASRHKIGVRGGGEVFGMWLDPGYGYDVDVTNGVAKGNEPESLYAVMSGTHYNGECCFDCEAVKASDTPFHCVELLADPVQLRGGVQMVTRRTTSLCLGVGVQAQWRRFISGTHIGTGIEASGKVRGLARTWKQACESSLR